MKRFPRRRKERSATLGSNHNILPLEEQGMQNFKEVGSRITRISRIKNLLIRAICEDPKAFGGTGS